MDVIEVEGVGKRYWRPRSGGRRSLRRPGDLFQREGHWALRDVSFRIGHGEAVGLIGVNGSGKSTLLRLLSGITRPTVGRIALSRPVSGLLTLGESFSGELTAADNALTAAMLGGLSRGEAMRRMPRVAEFAGLEDVMDQPVRTFSDGMKLRLAFAAPSRSLSIRRSSSSTRSWPSATCASGRSASAGSRSCAHVGSPSSSPLTSSSRSTSSATARCGSRTGGSRPTAPRPR